MRKVLVLGAAVMSVLLTGAGPPEGAGAQSDRITLQVCNNTRVPALVAISYQPIGSGTFRGEGWYNVAPGQCRNLAETTNRYMYGYAEVDGSNTDSWSGDHMLCVEYPGPYSIWDNGMSYCESWQETQGFVTLRAESFGVFTWNLND